MLKEAFSLMPSVFDSKLLMLGQMLFEQERVLNTRLSEGLLKGRVKGSNNQIYDVYMDLRKWPSTHSVCTCPGVRNCEHAAACLFFMNNRDYSQPYGQKPVQNLDILDRKLNVWLQNVTTMEDRKKEKKEYVLTYLLMPEFRPQGDVILIKLAIAKNLKKGGLGKKTVFTSLSEGRKQYFTPKDDEIVAELLFKSSHYGWFNNLETGSSKLLEKILATERAYAMQEDGDIIQLGPTCSPECSWELSPNGEQHFVLKENTQHLRPLLLDESWYYDKENLQFGKMLTPFSGFQLINLLDAPPVSLDQAAALAKKMAQICPEIPPPGVFTERKVEYIQPTPVLVFDALTPPPVWGHYGAPLTTLFTARLFFHYSDICISQSDNVDFLVKRFDDVVLLEYPRDKSLEKSALDLLKSWMTLRAPTEVEAKRFKENITDSWILTDVKSEADLGFLYETFIPAWKAKGWNIEFRSVLYQEQCSADDFEWFSDMQESGNDFFSYQLGILVEGKAVSIVPLVADLINQSSGSNLDAMSDEEKVKLSLDDGRALILEMGRIKPLVRLLLQFGSQNIDDGQQLKINRYQMLLLREAELATAATRARWYGAESLRDQLRQLITQKDLPSISVPKGLHAQLRDYQQQGLNWLHFLRVAGMGGVLADDMGLGKTIQTLALLQHEKEAGRLNTPSLIIAPTSLVGNWEAEARKFTPELKVLVFHGLERHEGNFENYDLIVSTYGLIQRDKTRFLNYHFYYLILDEAQFIKNARTKTTQIIQQLRASHRLCLSGTPMENHLGELWSLFNFLMPGLLGDARQFRQWFRTPIEKNGDMERRARLIQRVQPFMLRRTKNAVVKELPPKTEMLLNIDLIDKQRDLYEAIRMSMEKKVRDAIARQGLGKSHIILLDALLKLRQICCDPRLLSLPEANLAHGHSAKLDALMELLENLMEEGRRVLVFSQFTSMLSLIEKELQARQYRWLKLTGDTQNRQELVETFQKGEIPIFLISLKAGGTGLNLTKADTVIHYDPWWNPAVEDQATDRSHRIGQENPVFVYKLITSGTVEEAILKMQGKKRQLVEGILSSGTGNNMMLTESDIASFFMPLEDDHPD